ncbi:hypothetical protein CEUSTIGMA_g11328.t1 [Chlamydomonas eustigma]|uniref:isoamylase n=1 Tax=Chlamydomonas eustigma TaxID=1157962 RepID=A0A250XLF2_9CHLO|nr:hypothetical protein CEUSTIGMA_g11328.t1 [Chlamydomonas eustigma]|eukprot:GAX83904.1 hypothetical protein CEUSTIGMA_g11328.t1 [Chlamydomonas eustigma]
MKLASHNLSTRDQIRASTDQKAFANFLIKTRSFTSTSPCTKLNARRLGSKAVPNRLFSKQTLVPRCSSVTSQLESQSYQVFSGSPTPLGPSKNGSAVNFALYAKHASGVQLCLFDRDHQHLQSIQLETSSHKTGDVWHVQVEGLPGIDICYGYRVSGSGGWETGLRWDSSRVLLDPYAPLVSGRRFFGKRDSIENFQNQIGSQFLGTYDFESAPFDWGTDDARTPLHMKDLVIYEMPVRSFTASSTSGVPDHLRGTFLGVAEKADYFAQLGVNAVELLPVFEWDELEFQRNKNPRDHMVNIWGYSHINFFAPMSRFAASGAGPVAAAREFKQMVKRLHESGVEVLLDVVYNHTVESDDKDPYLVSFRGIDNKTYYMTDTSQHTQLINWSGCGNTINANNPVVTQLIVDSLVHWVTEYHVDGFRFDLASCLCRDEKGHPMAVPPLIRTISKHPILSKVKLIAEPWDLGLFQVGSFPNWDIWAEWNGKYRDDVRRFIKGDAGMKGAFATRLSGSADLYQTNQRRPYHSVNFVIAHDGFSLYDLVSYNGKHNDANGEGNRDGTNDNFSWNCGAEGNTGDAGVMALRGRQMRNYMLALMLSQGTPMIVMGDELAVTHQGNNNWYGHDNGMTQLDWSPLKDETSMHAGFHRFMSGIISFRKSHPAVGVENFLNSSDIVWHENDWANEESRFLAFTIKGKGGPDIYAAFNSHSYKVDVGLPPAPSGKKWCRVVDTNLPAPRDFTEGGNNGVDSKYGIEAHSSIMLIAKDA